MTDEERESRKSELTAQMDSLREEQREIHLNAERLIWNIERKIKYLESQVRRIDRLHSHGTSARYASGCRCENCRTAMARYQRKRAAARRSGDYRGVVPADSARAHLETIKAAGLSLNLLSRLSKIDSFYLFCVMAGRKKNIRADFADVILAWTPEIIAGEKKVRTADARRLIEDLEQRGFGLADVSVVSGVEESKLAEIKTRPYIETRIERAVLALA